MGGGTTNALAEGVAGGAAREQHLNGELPEGEDLDHRQVVGVPKEQELPAHGRKGQGIQGTGRGGGW